MGQIQARTVPLYSAKFMSYDLINIILKTADKEQLSYHFNIEDLSEFASLDQLEQQLHTLTKELCLAASKSKEADEEELHQNIVTYMNEHYKDFELSLEKMALIFQLSSPNLSRLIKAITGVTFTEYIWKLRLGEIKANLINTNRSVKEIVTEVGYIDVANFTRKFKKNRRNDTRQLSQKK